LSSRIARRASVCSRSIAAGDLERSNYTLALLELCYLAADFIHDTTELVAENVTLLHLDNGAVKQMQI
jgi:hypothetical protein